jgi:hypothetical protein
MYYTGIHLTTENIHDKDNWEEYWRNKTKSFTY